MSVDGLLVDILLPDESPTGDGSTLENALRVAYFEHLVMNDPLLGEKISSSFLRDWLSQLALCAMVMSATCGTNTQSELCPIRNSEQRWFRLRALSLAPPR